MADCSQASEQCVHYTAGMVHGLMKGEHVLLHVQLLRSRRDAFGKTEYKPRGTVTSSGDIPMPPRREGRRSSRATPVGCVGCVHVMLVQPKPTPLTRSRLTPKLGQGMEVRYRQQTHHGQTTSGERQASLRRTSCPAGSNVANLRTWRVYRNVAIRSSGSRADQPAAYPPSP